MYYGVMRKFLPLNILLFFLFVLFSIIGSIFTVRFILYSDYSSLLINTRDKPYVNGHWAKLCTLRDPSKNKITKNGRPVFSDLYFSDKEDCPSNSYPINIWVKN